MLMLMRVQCIAFFLTVVGGYTAWAQTDSDIKFIENKNQWPSSVDYVARIPGGRMFIEPGKFNYYLIDEKRLEELHEQSHLQRNEADAEIAVDTKINGHAVEVNFIGANPDAKTLPFGRSAEYYNYFIGNDPQQWASKAYAYDGFYYESLYNGISLKVYSAGNHIKYDFIAAPFADLAQVQLAYEGATDMYLDNGNLFIKTTLGDIIEKRPYAWQIIDGKKVDVESEYVLQGNRLSFRFPNGYDSCYELVIDPLLIFSTYSGSTADNWGSTATPGERGNLYSAGVTNQVTSGGTFPATAGVFQTTYGGQYDIGILKYDSAGHELLYATYLGGNNSESPHSLFVNSMGDLIVLGTTSSSNFPTTAGAYDRSFNGGERVVQVVDYVQGSDIFVARIQQDGSVLKGSTFIGGSENDGLNPNFGALTKNYGDQLRGDVITDADGNVYVSSVTASADFPVANGIDATYNGGETDALLFTFNADLTQLRWSTFLGGNGTDASHTLKLDEHLDIFIGGGTTSLNFPVTAGGYQHTLAGDADGWMAKVANAGDSIYYATFTGTTSFDQVYFLDLNAAGEVYVYGQTSGSFPVTPGVYSNPNSGQFVQKFDHTLSQLIFSTVFGSGRGIPDISPTAFLVNDCNNLYLAGWGGIVNSETGRWQSNTTGMPVSSDAYQKTTSGSDFYFIVLTDDGSERLYATFLGGTQSRTHVDGGTSRFDKSGIVYHAVCSGCAAFNATDHSTSDFPTTPGAWSRQNKSANCNNAAFKFDLSSLRARIQTNSVQLDEPGLSKVCIPDKIVFQNFSTGGELYYWDLGDGTKVVKSDTSMIVHQYTTTGRYTVWLKAVDAGTCKGKDSTSVKVDVFIAQSQVQDDDAICQGDAYTLQASGGAQYDWMSSDGSFHSTLQNPVVNPQTSTTYYVTITEAVGCVRKDTVQIDVTPGIDLNFELTLQAECMGLPTILVRDVTQGIMPEDIIYFDFGDGSTSDEKEVTHVYEAGGVYTVKEVGSRSACVYEKTVQIPVFSLTIPNVITPLLKDGKNDLFFIRYGNTEMLSPGDFGLKVSLVVYNRWGTLVYQSSDYRNTWAGEGLAAGVYYYEVAIDGQVTCKSWLQIIK